MIQDISLESFIICEIGVGWVLLYNKNQLDRFLHRFPNIDSKVSLENLKPVAGTKMYSSLLTMPIMASGAITGFMVITYRELYSSILVAVLSVAMVLKFRHYTPSENRIKQITCSDENLETELHAVLQCWLNKPLPNF